MTRTRTLPAVAAASLSLACCCTLALVAGGGCSQGADKARTTAAKPIENPNFQRYEFDLAPKQLLAVARRVVTSAPYSLPVESEQKGVLTTGWKEYQGAFHIVRYWQERTRFQVVVSPDFDDPTGKASLRVTQETETRASDQGHWFALLDEDRSDRATELAKAIQQAARAEAGGR